MENRLPVVKNINKKLLIVEILLKIANKKYLIVKNFEN